MRPVNAPVRKTVIAVTAVAALSGAGIAAPAIVSAATDDRPTGRTVVDIADDQVRKEQGRHHREPGDDRQRRQRDGRQRFRLAARPRRAQCPQRATPRARRRPLERRQRDGRQRLRLAARPRRADLPRRPPPGAWRRPGGDNDSSGHGGGDEDSSGHGGGDDDSSGHGGGDDDSSGHGGGDDEAPAGGSSRQPADTLGRRASRPGGRGQSNDGRSRKVRTPQGKVVGTSTGVTRGKVPQRQTASGLDSGKGGAGKGETVV